MHRHPIYISILMLVFFHENMRAQSVPESLINKLARAENDSVKTFTLLEMGESIEAAAPAKSMGYYVQALQLGRHSQINLNFFLTWIDIGNCYIELNKMDSAIAGFDSAIAAA